MCWKQEWGAAIGNIQQAIKHVEVAQVKLEKRRERNFDTLHTSRNERSDKFEERKIVERMFKNSEGIMECMREKEELKKAQGRLYHMIQIYGINRPNMNKKVSGHSENMRLKQLMKGYKR